MSAFPYYLGAIKELVTQHLELVEEPLHLAVYDAPERERDDAFLFEVLGNFEAGALVSDGDVLEVLYGPTKHFPLELRDDMLHVVLASPDEFKYANQRKTIKLAELKRAFAAGQAEIIYSSKEAAGLRKEIGSWPTLVLG